MFEEKNWMDTLKILIADDEPGMRTGAIRALKDLSVLRPDVQGECRFVLEEAETGELALELIRKSPPDILLLDHKMPGISGLDLLKQLADENIEVLTIMITAYASLEVAISATKRGAYDFLAKPFTPDELKGAVRKAAKHVMLQRQARKLAEEKLQVRFQFISVLAHELKAPLAAVEGYLQILKDRSLGGDPAAYEGMLDRCLVRSEHMRKLIIDLLDLTRIESGLKRRTLAPVDVSDLARLAIETAQLQAHACKIDIRLHAQAPVTMIADAGEIEVVLNNLISNAVKYNRDGGQVDVAIAAVDGCVRIEVSDTGIGIRSEDIPRLFEEFFRVRSEKTRSILGSGLGLSIVRKLARLYGGEAVVRSQPDVGSTFTVTLRDASHDSKPAPEVS